MKILLLGGTGAMGSHLTDLLSSDKNNLISVTTRKHLKSYDNVVYIQGNAHDDSFLDLILKEKWDVIVDFMVYNTDELNQRIFKLLDSCKHYVFLSSARVYANSESPLKESSPRLLDVCADTQYLSTDEYALTKARQEDILHNSGKSNWSIIRPYITYAENRLQLGVLELNQWLYRALLGHTILFSMDISEHFTTLTYGYDVARGITSILGDSRALGQTFHITTSKAIKWKDILNLYVEVIEKETGKRPKVKLISEHPYINDQGKKYQVLYDRRYDRIFDNSKIEEFIDISTFHTADNGIRTALSYFIRNSNLDTFPLDPIHEAKYDKITGEKMNLNAFNNAKDKLKYIAYRYCEKIAITLVKIKHLIK